MRRRTGWILVSAAVTIAATTAPVSAGFEGVTRRTEPVFDARRLDPAARAALGSYLQRPGASEFVGAVLQAQEELETFHLVYPRAVHDVTGDGAGDVLVLDYEITPVLTPGVIIPSFSFRTDVKVRVLDGRDGDVLWTKKAHFENGFLDVVEARVGARGDNGFAILVYDGAVGPVEQRRYTIRAVSARGKALWARHYESVLVQSFPAYAYANVPIAMEPFDALKPRPTDFLVGLGDVVWAGTGYAADVRALTVEGARGEETAHPGREVTVGTDLPYPTATRDVSGDGLDDYVFLNPMEQVVRGEEGPETGGAIRALRGNDGSVIWETAFDFSGTIAVWVFAGPDLAGSPAADFMLTAWVDDEQRMESGDDWDLYLVDGSNGSVGWRKRGGWPYFPGDVDGDGRGDVISRAVMTRGRRSSSVLMRAITWTGETIWTRKHLTEADPPPCGAACWTFYGVGFDEAGDLQRDGLVDSWVWLSIEHDPGPQSFHRYVVDARTGARSFVSGRDLFATGGSFDRRGDDLAFLRLARDGIAARGVDWSGRTVWESTLEVPLGSGDVELQAKATRLDADGCADLLVGIGGRRGQYVAVVDGGDGSLLWSRVLDGDGPSPRAPSARDANPAC